MRRSLRRATPRAGWRWTFLRRAAAAVAALLVGGCWPGPARALDLFTFRVEKAVRLGKARPTLTVHPDTDFKSITLRVTRSDGVAVTAGGKPAVRGRPLLLQWDQPEGEYGYDGVLAGVYPNGEEYVVPVAFKVFVGGALKMDVPRDRIDLGKGSLELQMSRAAGRVELTVLGPDGPLAEEVHTCEGESPGTPITVTWAPSGEVLKLEIKGYDQHGFFATEEVFPWTLDIPHEDVVFATGSAVIEATETPKLERAWDRVREAVDRYGRMIPVRLFVAGYTDTVGSASSNQELSNARARAIASWFKRKGFGAPLYYQGFGEQGLAAATPDETPDIRNRRAAYVLAAQTLPASPSFPGNAWRPVP